MTTSKRALFLYSEYLNIHMILWFVLMIFTNKVMGFPIWKQFAKTPFTVLPLPWSGILKMLVPTAQLPKLFVITPFQKKIMNIFPRNKTKQARTKASPIEFEFSNGQSNKFQNISMHISNTWTKQTYKKYNFSSLWFSSRGWPLQVLPFVDINDLWKWVGISISRKLREANNFCVSSERGLNKWAHVQTRKTLNVFAGRSGSSLL